ncbi:MULTISPECIES: hypothetical protein [unclassified Curtobacterium]|nr:MULTISPECIES: hypothetical protein [unclassified Curtobacterium]WIE81473.1 hypothetical protein DEJ19_019750 [Curtobacterium sp. MCSS17_016]
MTMPAGGGGWVPKSAKGKKALAIGVWTAAPIIAAFIIYSFIVGGWR